MLLLHDNFVVIYVTTITISSINLFLIPFLIYVDYMTLSPTIVSLVIVSLFFKGYAFLVFLFSFVRLTPHLNAFVIVAFAGHSTSYNFSLIIDSIIIYVSSRPLTPYVLLMLLLVSVSFINHVLLIIIFQVSPLMIFVPFIHVAPWWQIVITWFLWVFAMNSMKS